MRIIKLAVCDDADSFKTQLLELLFIFEKETGLKFEVDTWECGCELLNGLKNNRTSYDLIFSRIHLPDINGIKAATLLRHWNNHTPICFISSHTKYAFHAFEVGAIGYLQRPLQYCKLKELLQKTTDMVLWGDYKKKTSENYLRISSRHICMKINLADVLYIEKRKNQCSFRFHDREQLCYTSLCNIYRQLNDENKKRFVYIHQGYIANLDYIQNLFSNHVSFGAGIEAPVSRRHYRILKLLFFGEISK